MHPPPPKSSTPFLLAASSTFRLHTHREFLPAFVRNMPKHPVFFDFCCPTAFLSCFQELIRPLDLVLPKTAWTALRCRGFFLVSARARLSWLHRCRSLADFASFGDTSLRTMCKQLVSCCWDRP